MKKELAFKMACFCCLSPDTKSTPVDVAVPECCNSELNDVLKEIFSVDPRTNTPRGDIQYFLSSDGNPLVKQWLENNLLAPRRAASSNPEGVTDDLIVEMSRQSGETLSDYQSRLTNLFESAKAEYQRLTAPVVDPKPE